MVEGTFTFGGVTWGEDTPLVVESMAADMGEIRSEDAERPFGDGSFVGRDRLGSGTWEWEIATDAADFEDEGTNALDLWEQLQAAWRVAVREGVPGRLYPLTYTALGRTRRVYGRPRRASIPNGPDILAKAGQARGAVQFMLADPYTYDEDPQQVEISRIAPAGAGTTIPTPIPFMLGTEGSSRHGVVEVGGTAPTPFTATFHGPVTNPYLIGPDWEIRLEGAVDAGQAVSVDTREQVVMRGLTNVRGALRRGSTLGGRLQPGASRITYGGIDGTNTSRVTLSWRPAYYSI